MPDGFDMGVDNGFDIDEAAAMSARSVARRVTPRVPSLAMTHPPGFVPRRTEAP